MCEAADAPVKVQRAMCATCPFRKDMPSVMRRAAKVLLGLPGHTCHSANTAMCRGFYDAKPGLKERIKAMFVDDKKIVLADGDYLTINVLHLGEAVFRYADGKYKLMKEKLQTRWLEPGE